MKRSLWKRKPVPNGATFGLKRTPLGKKGKSDTAQTKDRIQGLVRAIVIIRDGGCIFRNFYYPDFPPCNGYRNDGELILQADHLVTRSNGATFADTRLVVCACKGHHGWKSVGGNARKAEYDAIVKRIISPERVALLERAESMAHRATPQIDWRLEEIALQQELQKLSPQSTDHMKTE